MSLKRNIFANYLGQAWTALMGLAFVPVYVRHLGVEAYGLVGFYAVLQACLVLLDMGITQTLGREMARYTAGQRSVPSIQTLLRSIEWVGAGTATILCAAIWLSASWLASHWIRPQTLAIPEIESAIAAMAFIIAMRLLEGLYRGGMLGLQQQVLSNVLGAALATVRWGGAAIVVVWWHPTITAFFAWQAAVSAVGTLVYRLILVRNLPATGSRTTFSLVALMEVRHFTGGMLATAGLALLLTQSDKLLLSRMLSLEAFGYYTLATLVSNALYQVVGPITQALYPRLTELAARRDATDLASTYHLGAQLMSVFLTPPALLLMVFGRDLLQVWTGDMVLALKVAPVLALLALGTMLNGLMSMPHMLQLAHGWSGFAARLNLVAVVLLLPLIVWVAPRYGTIGTAWVWVALNIGYVLVGIHYMHRRLLRREKWRWYWHDTALPVLPAVGIMVLSQLLHPAGLGQLMQWCWLLGTTALAWLAAGMGASAVRQRIPKIWSS